MKKISIILKFFLKIKQLDLNFTKTNISDQIFKFKILQKGKVIFLSFNTFTALTNVLGTVSLNLNSLIVDILWDGYSVPF